MFKSIKIKNLRGATDLTVDNLGQINLFVGKNNCGKTTLLEGVFLLIGATNPDLPASINVFRGLKLISNTIWPTYFHNFDLSIPIEIIGQLHNNLGEQKLSILPKYRETSVNEPLENSTSSLASDSKPVIEVDGLELKYSESKDQDNIITSTVFFKDNKLVTKGLKERSTRGIFVNPLTEFDWKIRFDAIQQKKQIHELINAIKKIEPNLLDLRLNSIGLLIGDIGLNNLIPVNLMGGGTARFLSIALAMLDSKNGIVLIDEIDNGLHYSVQQTIWKAVLAWSEQLNVQVFATTHSIECIKAFKSCIKSSLFSDMSKLYRLERDDNDFRSIEFNTEDLTISIENDWEIR